MAMKALDPAPSERLPVEGWELVATEAGRPAAGLIATIQAPQRRTATTRVNSPRPPGEMGGLCSDISQRSGCPAETITQTIRGTVPMRLKSYCGENVRRQPKKPKTQANAPGYRPICDTCATWSLMSMSALAAIMNPRRCSAAEASLSGWML